MTSAPREHLETVAGAVFTAFSLLLGTTGISLLGFFGFRWLVDQVRYAAWDAAWMRAQDRRRRPREV
jgi:hypothetical protein